MKLYILLPCYNEEEALPFLLDSLEIMIKSLDIPYEVVVINDGSEDNTAQTAKLYSKGLNLKVINHEGNLGLGKAVNTGLGYFYESCENDDAAVIMDADNTHSPALILRMLENIKKGKDVVIASRYEVGGEEIGLSYSRRLFSAGASLILKLFFAIPGVRDYTCGYRAYSGRIIKKAYDIYGDSFIEESGFTCMAEVIIKLNLLGCEISEIPLVLRYDLKKGKSKMKVLKTIRRYFTLILSSKHYRELIISKPAFVNGKEK
jgi:dolichol-phosphate mannosyltransferase